MAAVRRRASTICDSRSTTRPATETSRLAVGRSPILRRPSRTACSTVTLDFGGAPLNGNPRWLEIGVRPNGSPNGYTPLTPRQPLTAAPYSIVAGIAGGLPGLQVQQNASSPNLIGGYSGNTISPGALGSTIGGGGHAGFGQPINSIPADSDRSAAGQPIPSRPIMVRSAAVTLTARKGPTSQLWPAAT